MQYLRNMVINLRKGDQSRDLNQVQSINSNYEGLKEEETVHQLTENMEIVKLNSDPMNTIMEDVTTYHAFY
jgi:hypothetical protein